MVALARAVVHALAFLELSDDDAIDPDSAVQAMEMLAYDLQKCTDEEKVALKYAMEDEYKAKLAQSAPKKVLDFYENLLEYVGLEESE